MNWNVWIKLFQRKEKMLNRIIDIVRSCGNIIKEVSADNVNIKNDNPKNLVTEYDTKVQEILKNELRQILPEASFLGEEGEQHYSKSGFCFVCDTCKFSKSLAHKSCLKTNVAIAHFTINFSLWSERCNRVDYNNINRARTHQALSTFKTLFTSVWL